MRSTEDILSTKLSISQRRVKELERALARCKESVDFYKAELDRRTFDSLTN